MDTAVRREQIAEAALSLLAEQGVGALTARGVARAVGLTAPALYKHFPGGKADILASILDLLDEVKSEGLRAALQASGTSLDKLRRCYDLHTSVIQRYRALPNLVLSDTLWIDEPQLRDRLLANHLTYKEKIAEIIHQGQKQGEIRTDIPSDQISTQFMGQILTVAILYGRPCEMIDLHAQAEANWKMFIRGISVDPFEKNTSSK